MITAKAWRSKMRASRPTASSLANAQRAPSQPRCPSYLHHRPRLQAQSLHTTPNRPAKHRSPYRSITQAELKRIADARASLFPKYTQEERQEVRGTYTLEQQRSIDLGEAAIDPYDLSRAKPRRDFLRPRTIDRHGLSRLQPVIDKRPSTSRGEWDNSDDNQPTANLDFLPDENKRIKRIGDIMAEPSNDPFEFADGNEAGPGRKQRDLMSDLWHQLKHGKVDHDNPNFEDLNIDNIGNDISTKAGGGEQPPTNRPNARANQEEELEDEDDLGEAEDEALLRRIEANLPQSVRDRDRSRVSTADRLQNALRWRDHPDPPELSQDLPKINDPRWMYSDSEAPGEEDTEEAENKAGDDEAANAWARLARQLGKPVDQLQKYRMKLLVQRRVVNQTRLGKIASEYLLYVCGDENGMVGLGEGKAVETDVANRTAMINAVRSMKPIRRYEKRTIYGEVIGKVGAVEVKLNARPPGFGLRCSSYAYEIAKCAGLQDLQAKSLRSRNPMNVAKAIVEALQSQRDPEDVARSRGKKLVDVRKVYYAGLV